MEPDFRALQVLAEVSLGIVGFSAILIGLSRSKNGFSRPDNFRIQLLTFSAFGAMFCALLPFAIFNQNNIDLSWTIVNWSLCLYSTIGLLIFPRRVFDLRREGYKDLFPFKIVLLQVGILITIFILSGSMILGFIEQKNNFYLFCLILFVVQSTVAFIRTMFVRVE
tara:strand:+ start:155 stop:652 length:498 start_codon:yes stop_codon:yes gene_type:complete